MIIPIRCFTCNYLIADKWSRLDKTGYIDLLKLGYTSKEALDRLGFTRFCCRRMILSNVDMVSKLNF